MKLNPKYSYEYNCILNEKFSEIENIKNFASLLSDKDRFLILLKQIENNTEYIEKKLGFKLKQGYEFYIVRTEKFKSFSEPITIEYSILPEEMLLFLLKEILKISSPQRFPDEIIREEFINLFIDYLLIHGKWETNLIKSAKILHEHSKNLYKEYNYQINKYDFEKNTFQDLLLNLYEDFNFS